ncbi:DUF4124 domain-containing protein [Massilia sp. P8910]|uniref:DUF4124 domain-containing protein n=1 Tax=Massilia antarctica TaxID=2765360 RepID=UPI001E3B6549|nr:DUF4124 domain-containing protein [Massilia antarctica]MCE3607022.1 DUF4124 domain-containing protein [Massilia antarctica]
MHIGNLLIARTRVRCHTSWVSSPRAAHFFHINKNDKTTMMTGPLCLALILAGAHAAAHAQVIKCQDGAGHTTYQSTPCAAAQGAREQKMATPGHKPGSATTAAPKKEAVSPEQADMAAVDERTRVRMCEIYRKNVSVLKDSEKMIVADGKGALQVADARRRAAEIAQAEQRVAQTCK